VFLVAVFVTWIRIDVFVLDEVLVQQQFRGDFDSFETILVAVDIVIRFSDHPSGDIFSSGPIDFLDNDFLRAAAIDTAVVMV
jgi:hypothetical protein